MGRRLDQLDEIAGVALADGDYLVGYRPSSKGIRSTVSSVVTKVTAGLGNSATRNVGTTAGTVSAGDHTHTSLTMNSITLVCASDLSTHVVSVKKDSDTGDYYLDLA